MTINAFVHRISPSEVDHVPLALESDQLIIGWSHAAGLLDLSLGWENFRQIVHDAYHAGDTDYRRSGSAAGNMWRFIREMAIGDLVVVPHWSYCYLAEVTGAAIYDESRIEDDTAYRRPVRWLNDKQGIPRKHARAAFQSRMKAYQTCVWASDLIDDISDLRAIADSGTVPSFATDLRLRLQEQALKELHSGRLNSFDFEKLVAEVLTSLGSSDVRIVPRNKDKGADVIASFSVARTFPFLVAVQAKHYQAEPPIEAWVIDQLANGMEAEGASLGWVATSGTFSESAVKRKEELERVGKVKIELVDGQQFATLLIEAGLQTSEFVDSVLDEYT